MKKKERLPRYVLIEVNERVDAKGDELVNDYRGSEETLSAAEKTVKEILDEDFGTVTLFELVPIAKYTADKTIKTTKY